MATYCGIFDTLGLQAWSDAGGTSGGPMSMAQLLAQTGSAASGESAAKIWEAPFPSLDALHQACGAIPRTRDMTAAVERAFLDMKDSLKVVLDPLTQPLSWLLQRALEGAETAPWWIVIPLVALLVHWLTRSARVTGLVLFSLLFLAEDVYS